MSNQSRSARGGHGEPRVFGANEPGLLTYTEAMVYQSPPGYDSAHQGSSLKTSTRRSASASVRARGPRRDQAAT